MESVTIGWNSRKRKDDRSFFRDLQPDKEKQIKINFAVRCCEISIENDNNVNLNDSSEKVTSFVYSADLHSIVFGRKITRTTAKKPAERWPIPAWLSWSRNDLAVENFLHSKRLVRPAVIICSSKRTKNTICSSSKANDLPTTRRSKTRKKTRKPFLRRNQIWLHLIWIRLLRDPPLHWTRVWATTEPKLCWSGREQGKTIKACQIQADLVPFSTVRSGMRNAFNPFAPNICPLFSRKRLSTCPAKVYMCVGRKKKHKKGHKEGEHTFAERLGEKTQN